MLEITALLFALIIAAVCDGTEQRLAIVLAIVALVGLALKLVFSASPCDAPPKDSDANTEK